MGCCRRISGCRRRDPARDIERNQRRVQKGVHAQGVNMVILSCRFSHLWPSMPVIGSGSSSDAVDYAGESDRRCIGHFTVCGFRKLHNSDLSVARWGLFWTSEVVMIH